MREPNMLYYGDNLDVLRRYIKDSTVDLVYLDPPFNSNQDYNVLFEERTGEASAAQIKAFEDTWTWNRESARVFEEFAETGGRAAKDLAAIRKILGDSDLMAYLSMMAPRLVELHRVLKPTGTLYLHCDWHASHYLRILLDSIFGPENFQNEIIWKRTTAHVDTDGFGHVHDTILRYSRSSEGTWNPQYRAYSPEYIARYFTNEDEHVEERGKYWTGDITGAGLRNGETGKPWRGIDPATVGKGRHWVRTPEELEKLDAQGRIAWPTKGGKMPKMKRYLNELPGLPYDSVWDSIPSLGGLQGDPKERLGYPTQKPLDLLSLIIEASSNAGDTVLDPFCGCGTTIDACQRLGRRWIGIDITHLAITLIRSRLNYSFDGKVDYKVIGEPTDLTGAQSLALEDRYQFQWWALGKVDARPTPSEQKKGADKGIDGRLFFHEREGGETRTVILQVKSGKVDVGDIRDLVGTITREDAQIGALIALEKPTGPMLSEAASAGFYKPKDRLDEGEKYPRIQILTIEDLIAGRKLEYPHVRNVTYKAASKAPLARTGPKHRIKKLSLPGFAGQGVLRADESEGEREEDGPAKQSK
jgi:DNA modification methylase